MSTKLFENQYTRQQLEQAINALQPIDLSQYVNTTNLNKLSETEFIQQIISTPISSPYSIQVGTKLKISNQLVFEIDYTYGVKIIDNYIYAVSKINNGKYIIITQSNHVPNEDDLSSNGTLTCYILNSDLMICKSSNITSLTNQFDTKFPAQNSYDLTTLSLIYVSAAIKKIWTTNFPTLVNLFHNLYADIYPNQSTNTLLFIEQCIKFRFYIQIINSAETLNNVSTIERIYFPIIHSNFNYNPTPGGTTQPHGSGLILTTAYQKLTDILVQNTYNYSFQMSAVSNTGSMYVNVLTE